MIDILQSSFLLLYLKENASIESIPEVQSSERQLDLHTVPGAGIWNPLESTVAPS